MSIPLVAAVAAVSSVGAVALLQQLLVQAPLVHLVETRVHLLLRERRLGIT